MLGLAKWFSTLDLKSGGCGSAFEQEEDCFLDWTKAMAVHVHAL
jgi:hypothetical protein